MTEGVHARVDGGDAATSGARAPSSNALADDRTQLAVARTLVALDRTLMAWIRTATSLISFGFTMYKFIQALRDGEPAPEPRLIGSREFALIMMALGTAALLFATLEYRSQVKSLRLAYPRYGPFRRSPTAAVAAVVAALGVLGFVVVLFHQ
jgi:putative membrane protein